MSPHTAARKSRRCGGVLVAAACALWILTGADALALKLPGAAAADRAALAPLRNADLAALLDGAADDRAWAEAASRLPEHCAQPAALVGSGCPDDARCAWLAARAAVLGARARDAAARSEAAEFLHRAAARLADDRCAGEERWRADARSAARDDALVQLTLLKETPAVSGPPVLEGDDARQVESLLAGARSGGLRSLDADALGAARTALRRAYERNSWLAGQPALARLRAVLPVVWAPLGTLPAECGASLLRNELLDDQWRGYMVREAAASALECFSVRLAPLLGQRGRPPSDPGAVAALSSRLAAQARRDPGGRQFGADADVVRGIDALVAALQPAAGASVARASWPERAPRRAARGGPRAPASRWPESAAERDTASSAREDSAAEAPSRLDPDLVALAGQVGRLVGADARLRSGAAGAIAPGEQRQFEGLLLVELHRAVCAPLDEASPADLDAARRVLSARAGTPHEEVCRGGEGRAALRSLLREAPGLQRLGAASRLRAAGRLLALGRADDAKVQLGLVPDALRGVAWSILTAWCARLSHDPVEAARALAHVDPEIMDRLHASADENLARLAAHAGARAAP